MPREKDLSLIPTGRRTYVKTQEWPEGETRTYFYTGYEKVTKISPKKGTEYVQYYIYLLPLDKQGNISEEVTLGVFPNSVGNFKEAGIADYQEVSITREVKRDSKGEQENYAIVSAKNILPLDQRPVEVDYPEIVATPPTPPNAQVFTPKLYKGNPSQEINIDDIPF